MTAFPNWSPDGSKVVFCSDRSGDIEIYTVGADGSELTRLTRTPGRDAHPNWAPEGGNIVFQSPRDGANSRDVDLYVMAADGTDVKRLTHLDGFAGVPMYSPDGQQHRLSVQAGRANGMPSAGRSGSWRPTAPIQSN